MARRAKGRLGERLDARGVVSLPDDAVTQGFAILARRRSGKSVTAGVMQEIFCRRGDPWVVLDPVSAHWGIKYLDHNGKPGGASPFEVLIVGGKFADVPLDDGMGASLAEILVETDISCVVDMKELGMRSRKRFVTAFANRLFEINETPRHVFLEEAHEFVPQTPRFPEQMEVLGACERLVKGGGGLGLGFTLISQRPAEVSKAVLEQIDNLILMRMFGPNDLKAAKAWFEHNVGDKDQMKHILGSLPAFSKGEAWLLSPEWLGEVTRLQMDMRTTFHAGRTPKRGETPLRPKKVDVSRAVQRFRVAAEQRQLSIVTEADKDVRITDLEREIGEAKRELETANADSGEQADGGAEVLDKLAAAANSLERVIAERDELNASLTEAIEEADKMRVHWGEAMEALKHWNTVAEQIGQLLAEGALPHVATLIRLPPPVLPTKPDAPAIQATGPMERVTMPRSTKEVGVRASLTHHDADPAATKRAVAKNGNVSSSQQRILDVLAMFVELGVEPVARAPLAALGGSRVKSSSFANNLSALSTGGYVVYPRAGTVQLTKEGATAAQAADPVRGLDDLHERWLRTLSKPQGDLLRYLIANRTREVPRAELMEACGVGLKSSSFANNVSALSTMGVVHYPGPGLVQASDVLFPEGLR